jgi:hypothetical protein
MSRPTLVFIKAHYIDGRISLLRRSNRRFKFHKRSQLFIRVHNVDSERSGGLLRRTLS